MMPIEIHTAFVAHRDKFGGFAEAFGYVLERGEKVDRVMVVGDTPEVAVCNALEQIVLQRRGRCDADPERHIEHGKISPVATADWMPS